MDDDDKDTPATDPKPETVVKPPEHPVQDPTPANTPDVGERIGNLEQTVNGLVETVSVLTAKPAMDETPQNVPWTHRWFGKR